MTVKILRKSPSLKIYFNFSRKRLFFNILLWVVAAATFIAHPQLLTGVRYSGDSIFYLNHAMLYGLIFLAIFVLSMMDFAISQRYRKILSWLLLTFVPFFCTVAVEWINYTDLFHSYNIVKWFGNYLCYLMIFTFFFALTRRISFAIGASSVLTVGFGIATYYTTLFRGTPVLPWDIQGLGTAMDVAGGYEYLFTYQMVFTALMLIFILIFAIKTKPENSEYSSKQRFKERVASLAISLVLIIAIIPCDLLGTMGIKVWPWNQKASTSMTGVTAGFFGNLQFVIVDKPSNYSTNKVEGLLKETENNNPAVALGNPPKAPNIICIMNESFSDMEKTSNGNMKLSEDNMPFVHSLMEDENVISGTAYSSVFGGNTCDSEYEFLSGNSMSFFPYGSKPYQQYIKEPQSSLASNLKEQGYKTMAIHPGEEDAWNRSEAYPLLGFDSYIYAKAFNTKRNLLRGLTDDASCYNEVIYQYEQHKGENPDQPIFMWNVTIQNHGGFAKPNYNANIKIENSKEDFPEAEQYLSLISDSDEDLKEFISYLEEQGEPIILLFFGDHWPNINSEYMEFLLGIEDLDKASTEDSMRKYEVPYFIWANYDLDVEAVDYEISSLNYLSSLMLSCTGLETSPYNQYLNQLHDTLPVITQNGIIDSSGEHYSLGENHPYKDLLNEYFILQYNQVFDKEGKLEVMFLPAQSKTAIDDVFDLSNSRQGFA